MFYRLNRRNLVLVVNPIQRLFCHLDTEYAFIRIVIAIYTINILVIRGFQLGINVNHFKPERIHLLLVKDEA